MHSDFDRLKKQFLSEVRSIVIMKDIPAELIMNWDLAGLKYVPILDCNWTFAEKGTKIIEIVGLDDKKQISVADMLNEGKAIANSNKVIYGGITPACLLKVASLKDWYLCYTDNHWSNEEIMMAY